MRPVGDKKKATMRPEFDRSISIDFQGVKITGDADLLVMREIDQRFNIPGAAASRVEDQRSSRHTDHPLLQLLRQRVYQVAAGYEDCNDADHLNRPVGRPSDDCVQVGVIEFPYQAEKWSKLRKLVCKIEWYVGELFPRVGFIATNSNMEAQRVITVCNGRTEIENRIKEGKNTLRWDKTSCHRFAANQAGLSVGCLADNLLHIIRDTAFWGESLRPSIDSVIRRLVKVGARVVCHARRWHVHIVPVFPLGRYYGILFS